MRKLWEVEVGDDPTTPLRLLRGADVCLLLEEALREVSDDFKDVLWPELFSFMSDPGLAPLDCFSKTSAVTIKAEFYMENNNMRKT